MLFQPLIEPILRWLGPAPKRRPVSRRHRDHESADSLQLAAHDRTPQLDSLSVEGARGGESELVVVSASHDVTRHHRVAAQRERLQLLALASSHPEHERIETVCLGMGATEERAREHATTRRRLERPGRGENPIRDSLAPKSDGSVRRQRDRGSVSARHRREELRSHVRNLERGTHQRSTPTRPAHERRRLDHRPRPRSTPEASHQELVGQREDPLRATTSTLRRVAHAGLVGRRAERGQMQRRHRAIRRVLP